MNHDEKPVSAQLLDLESVAASNPVEEVQQEAPSESQLQDRLVSKNWKTRSDAYSELAAKFSAELSTSEIYAQHQHLLAKYVGDPHPMAQDNALTALKNFLAKGTSLIAPQLTEIVTALLEKCVSSSRPNIREKSLEILTSFGKSEVGPTVTQNIIEFLSLAKSPKTALAGIQTLCELIKKYGTDALDLSEIFKVVEKQATTSTNPLVRTEALKVYKEAHKFSKEEVVAHIAKLKPTQQEELKKEFSGVGQLQKLDKKPHKESVDTSDTPFTVGTEKTRCETEGKNEDNPMRELEKKRVSEPAAVFPDDQSSVSIDPLASITGSMKWNEKKARLDEFISLCTPEMAKSLSLVDTVNSLKTLLRDNNVLVINATLTVIGNLAKITPENFAPYKKPLVHLVVIHYKDKKAVQAVNFCLDHLFPADKVAEAFDAIKDELSDKSPAVKVNLCHWIEEKLAKLHIASLSKAAVETGLLAALLKLTDEGTGEVRDAAYSCISLVKLLGEKGLLEKYCVGIQPQKTERINKAAEAAKTKWGIEGVVAETMEDFKEEIKTTSPFRSSRSSISKPPKKPVDNRVTVGPTVSPSKVKSRAMSDICDFETSLKDSIPASILELISKEAWKERQRGLGELYLWLEKNMEVAKGLSEPLVQFLNNKFKGFKENNVSVLKELLALLQVISTFRVRNKYMTDMVVPELLEKAPDSKWTETCTNLIMNVANSSGLSCVLSKIIAKLGANSKNHNIIKGTFIVLSKLIEVHSLDQSLIKTIVEGTKPYISNPNQGIRISAHEFYCKFYSVVGEELRHLLGEPKENFMKILVSEFAKVQIKASDMSVESKQTLDKHEPEPEAENIRVSISATPRANLASKVSQKILAELADSSVKKRQEAKDQLEKIIAQSGRVSSIGLAPLMTALKGRMSEPCKNLCKSFIGIIGNLTCAMGCGAKQYAKIILPSLISNLSDKQSSIRSESISAMDKFAEAAGGETVINSAGALLEKDNPDLRLELLSWISKHEESLARAECGGLVSGLISCLQDRSKEVRGLSEKVIKQILPIVKKDPFMNALKDLKPIVKDGLVGIIEKLDQPQPMELDEITFNPINPAAAPTETPIVLPGVHEKLERIELDKRVKWGQNEPKSEFLTRLKRQCARTMNSSLVELMFGTCENIQESIKRIESAVMNDEPITEVLDLLLKWAGFLLSVPETMDNTIDLLKVLFEGLLRSGYQMLEFEASAIFPSLVEALGSCGKRAKELIKLSVGLYPVNKVWGMLIRGLDTKNVLAKQECLAILKEIVEGYGMKVLTARDVKTFGKLLCGEDSECVKDKCVEILSSVYKIKGEAMWANLGTISEVIREQLREKIGVVAAFSRTQTFSLASIGPLPSISPKSTVAKDSPVFALALKPAIDIPKALAMLKEDYIDTKVEALVYLNEIVENGQNNQELVQNIDQILETFANTLRLILVKPLEEIPVKFAKHFINVLHKICSSKDLIQHTTNQTVEQTLEKLLSTLLREGIEKLGEQKEGETVMKYLNSSILRVLENCAPTKVLCGLIRLLIKHKNDPEGNKFPGLVVKCVLKLTKVMQSLLPELGVGDLIIAIHEYLLVTSPHPPFASPHDELGVKTVKTIINELVKILRENIWEHYSCVESHPEPDNNIKRWIAIILSSINSSYSTNPELAKIIEELKVQNTFQQALVKLSDYKAKNPAFDLGQSLKCCGPAFSAHVLGLLAKSQAPQIRPSTARLVHSRTLKMEKQQTPVIRKSSNTVGLLTQRVEGISTLCSKSDKKQTKSAKKGVEGRRNSTISTSSALTRKRTIGSKKN